MTDVLRREAIYFWYYFSVQFEQIFGYWILGMLIGSFVSDCSLFFTERDERRLAGSLYDVINPPQSTAYYLQRSTWHHGAGGADRDLLSVWDRGRTADTDLL